MAEKKIAVIGCGAMGGAIARVLAKKHEVFLYDKHAEAAEAFAIEIGAKACNKVGEVVQDADVILLAVKPQDLKVAAGMLFGKIRDNQVLVSVLGGVPLSTLAQHFGSVNLLRMLPSVACAFGKGVIGLIDNQVDQAEFDELFADLGHVMWIPEDQANAFTALGGSGPAFIYLIVESLVDAGVAMGMSAKQSKKIALEMIGGAVEVMDQTGLHPGALKWQVTSPGGATIAGVKQMEDEAVRSGLINTILAANQRLIEMG